jgi:DNA (cytosine-5)-methyltransferase 1
VADLDVVEICAGAGGQALGLERAGFEHALAVELDAAACATLRANRPGWKVAEGDVAEPALWRPRDYHGVALLAGGVPCPPFTVAGRQLGAADERDLFAWAVELCGVIRPRALLLENVRGLSTARFSAYRQHVLDRLRELGYVPGWRLLHASDFGVPQLRPRFVLVALRPDDAPWFRWPSGSGRPPATVGQTLGDLMAARGWPGAAAWARRADRIAPTIVGGSKKHGGADLGPTRAKRAWAELGVDGLGIADEAPPASAGLALRPRLTCEMVTRLQGWQDEWDWRFSGLKTARYRQIGNAFPPPVAEAVGTAIRLALEHAGPAGAASGRAGAASGRAGAASGRAGAASGRAGAASGRAGAASGRADEVSGLVHDPVFLVLRSRDDFLTARQIADLVARCHGGGGGDAGDGGGVGAGGGAGDGGGAGAGVGAGAGGGGRGGAGAGLSAAAVLGRLRHLAQDFELEVAESRDGPAYRLGEFKAFLGQHDHVRHKRFAARRATIS